MKKLTLILILLLFTNGLKGTTVSFDMEHLQSIGARPYLYNEIYKQPLKHEPLIAILDTGFSPDRKDFINSIHPSSQTISGKKISSRKQRQMHGSHVACLAGGLNSEFAGVAPNSKVLLIDIKDFTNFPREDISQMDSLFPRIMRGMEIAFELGADVINFSGGLQKFEPSQEQEIKMRALLKKLNKNGVVTVFASGNSAKEIKNTKESFYPQRYSDEPGVIVVGSYDTANFSMSPFSNYSETYVDIYAPGAVVSRERKGLYSCWGDDFKRKGGTSMAAPIVAGAVALVIRKFRIEKKSYEAGDIEKYLVSHSLEIKEHSSHQKKLRYLNLPTLLLEN